MTIKLYNVKAVDDVVVKTELSKSFLLTHYDGCRMLTSFCYIRH